MPHAGDRQLGIEKMPDPELHLKGSALRLAISSDFFRKKDPLEIFAQDKARVGPVDADVQ
jgi:hypothetical protein